LHIYKSQNQDLQGFFKPCRIELPSKNNSCFGFLKLFKFPILAHSIKNCYFGIEIKTKKMMNKVIGSKIFELRKNKGWSQEQVAESLQIS